MTGTRPSVSSRERTSQSLIHAARTGIARKGCVSKVGGPPKLSGLLVKQGSPARSFIPGDEQLRIKGGDLCRGDGKRVSMFVKRHPPGEAVRDNASRSRAGVYLSRREGSFPIRIRLSRYEGRQREKHDCIESSEFDNCTCVMVGEPCCESFFEHKAPTARRQCSGHIVRDQVAANRHGGGEDGKKNRTSWN